MKSCKELWKSVASLSASSSLTCETDHQHGNNQAVFAATCGRVYQAENKTVRLLQHKIKISVVPSMTFVCTEDV